jgi:hypothetical protein
MDLESSDGRCRLGALTRLGQASKWLPRFRMFPQPRCAAAASPTGGQQLRRQGLRRSWAELACRALPRTQLAHAEWADDGFAYHGHAWSNVSTRSGGQKREGLWHSFGERRGQAVRRRHGLVAGKKPSEAATRVFVTVGGGLALGIWPASSAGHVSPAFEDIRNDPK